MEESGKHSRAFSRLYCVLVVTTPLIPLRGAFFEKGVHPFLSFIAGEAARIDLRREFVGAIKSELQLPIEGPLPIGHSLPRFGGDLLRQVRDCSIELNSGNDPVDQSP